MSQKEVLYFFIISLHQLKYTLQTIVILILRYLNDQIREIRIIFVEYKAIKFFTNKNNF